MSTAPVRPLAAPRKRRAAGRDDAPARETLKPEAWIEAATEVLVNQGIDHVRVDVLAGELKVTRGSFYWHFRDREELLRRVLQAWRESTTVNLTKRLIDADPDPRQQLRDVLSLPFRGKAAVRGARIELAIRAWARRDETARHAVDEADASRMAYIAQIFSALGFPVVEAQQRAFAIYAYVVGESLMANQGSEATRAERRRFMERLAVANLAS